MIHNKMLYNTIGAGTIEKSYIYYCNSDKHYKIGQTAQTYVSQRIKTLRKDDKNIALLGYIEFNGSKALREYIESITRLYLQGQGYNIIGNDHLTKRYCTKTFKKHCIDIITATLNDYNINYTVINRQE